MKDICDLESVVSELSYELSLWPISPTNVLHVGGERSCDIVRRYLDYAKLTFICLANEDSERNDQFWNSAEWTRHQDLVICLNLFTTQASSRNPNFFNKARASLLPNGRLIALDQLPKASAEYKALEAAANEGGMRLTSTLCMDANKSWNCLVFQNTQCMG